VSGIVLRGLRAGNLRNLDLELPHGRWTAIHGPSGAGKSALLFRTLEPVARQRFRILEYPRALPGQEEEWLPHVADSIVGLQPVLAAAGEIPRGRRKVEVGTALDLWPALLKVFASHGQRRCLNCDHRWRVLQVAQLLEVVQQAEAGSPVHLFSAAEGSEVGRLLQAGWTRVRLGEAGLARLEEAPDPLPAGAWLLLDRLKWRPALIDRLQEAGKVAVSLGRRILLEVAGQRHEFAAALICPQCEARVGPREVTELLPSRDAEDWVLQGRTWKQWCAAPLSEWLQLPGEPGFRAARRLEYLHRTRLGHLAANRTLGTLSLGEGRRMELVALLSQARRGQLALFDEPGMGLHGSERRAVAQLLRELVVQGNTVLTADPAREFLEAADQWLLLGPGGGAEGGTIVGQGPRAELPAAETETATEATAATASASPTESKPSTRKAAKLSFRKLQHRYLNIAKLELPLGQLLAIVGVSGSGKSTLLDEELVPRLREERDFKGQLPIGGVAVLSERALGSSAFSTIATLSGAWSEIRRAFADGEEARIRGLSHSDLVARMGQGACTLCRGHGLDPAGLPCGACVGMGLRDDLLELRLRNRSLQTWLTTPLQKLEKRLPSDGRLRTLVKHLTALGLGDRTFGERGRHLSLGERGRIALAKALASSRRDRPKLFLLDEPCLGLPFTEARRVVALLKSLCQQGHSFWVVEHHEVLLRNADQVVEIGPGAGPQGGQLLYQGSAEKLIHAETPTGQWLATRATVDAPPADPEPQQVVRSQALADDWSRSGRRALEQDLLRELSTRSPLLRDMPAGGLDLDAGEDLSGAAATLAPTAWPVAAPSETRLLALLGLENSVQRAVQQAGSLGCGQCAGRGPWRDLAQALDTLIPDSLASGVLDFTAPLHLPQGSQGSETALLQAAGFRLLWRRGQTYRLQKNTQLEPADEVWLDQFDPASEARTGRIQDLEHHAHLLGGGHLHVHARRQRQARPWHYQQGACADCGALGVGVAFQLAGRDQGWFAEVPLQQAMQHLCQHAPQSEIFQRALALLRGTPLLQLSGDSIAAKWSSQLRRLARLAGWLLFPLEGVVLLHDQPLSGLPPALAKRFARAMIGTEVGWHRYTDPEGFTLQVNPPPKAQAKVDAEAISLAPRVESYGLEFDLADWADPPMAPQGATLRQALALQLPFRQHFLRTEEARLRGWTEKDLGGGPQARTCSNCHGQGGLNLHPELQISCPQCKGSGWAKECRALDDRGLRWPDLGSTSLTRLAEHYQETPSLARILQMAVQSGMGEVRLDTPLSHLAHGIRAWAPILAQLASGRGAEEMRWAAPFRGLNRLEVWHLTSTIEVLASRHPLPKWRENHPALLGSS
jgi:excinuclease ABC subunit A